MSVPVKKCRGCDMDKYFDEFSICRRSGDGRQFRCRECQRVYAISYNAKRRSKGITKEYDRNKNLRRYGLNIKLYADLLKAQDFCCASCGRNQDEFTIKFVVDHDHSCCPGKKVSCGKCIRGLLCHSCNVGLGYANDSVARLTKMIEYLNKSKNILAERMI